MTLVDEAITEILSDADSKEWFDERPLCIQEAVRKRPCNLLYLLNNQQKVFIVKYDEHHNATVTVTVAVTRQYNNCLMERQVFGVTLDELVPLCNVNQAVTHTINRTPEMEQAIDRAGDELKQAIDHIQETIPDNIVGDERRELVFAKLDEIIGEALKDE